jgi:[ribosomal protein S5]-alanine N-acetyltransferase
MEHKIGFETASLIVRRFTHQDYEELQLLTAQKEITDLLPDWAMTEEQLRDFLSFVIGSYETFDPEDVRVLLALEHKGDRRLIGWCGVFPNEQARPER